MQEQRLTYRLYFWFRGAPEDRKGGPWWMRELETEQQRRTLLKALKPFLHKYAECDVPRHGKIDPDAMRSDTPPIYLSVQTVQNQPLDHQGGL